MSFCIHCGSQLEDGAAFCTRCGVKTDSAAMAKPATSSGPPAESEPSRRPHQPAAMPGNTSPSALPKILLWVGAALLIFAGLAIAGVLYIGHRVEKRVSAAIHAAAGEPASPEKSPQAASPITSDQDNTHQPRPDGPQNDGGDPDVAKGLDAIGGLMDRMGFGDRPPNPYADLPVVKSDAIRKNLCDPGDESEETQVSASQPAGPSGIPMVKGLVLVHAWGRKMGDSETIDSVSKITGKYVEVSNAGTFFQNADDEHGNPGSAVRDVCADDVQTASGLSTGFGSDNPRTLPGTTTINVSQTLFNALRTKGTIDFRYLEYYRMPDLEQGEGYLHWEGGPLTRVESGDVALPVIVNGTPTMLPAIHASGTLWVEDKKARELSQAPGDKPHSSELYVLDDPANPLLLLFKQNINNFRLQITEIHFPLAKPETKIEHDLLKNKKAVVYGIYFDYNSDKLKKESEPVLKEIALAMKNNPDWKLTVDGHTDSIGGDAYNLDLSKRRATAVKQALVDRFQIDGDRLLADGFGQRRPVDRNDTLDGRARNRRVELTRE